MQVVLTQIDTESITVQPNTQGVFKASNEITDEKFMELLNINGGAALFSIARSKIEVLSSLTYTEGKIILPMINIIQYFAERNAPNNDE